MNYNSILEGHNCKCLSNTIENYTDLFARRVGNTKDFKSRDFRTHCERGLDVKGNSCEDICGFRGVSIDLWNDESKEYIIEKFALTVSISPMIGKPKNSIGVFRIAQGTGKVKYTPNQQHGVEIYHHDLYKSDTFAVENLEIVELIPIVNSNV